MKGKYHELMTQDEKLNEQLEEFLREHPIYHWIAQVRKGDYSNATLTLYGEAERETSDIKRRKVLFSLCKLSIHSVFSSNPQNELLAACNQHLTLIDAQSQFSPALHALSVGEIIDAILSAEIKPPCSIGNSFLISFSVLSDATIV